MGHMDSQYVVGAFFATDISIAMKYLEMAADQGHVDAQNYLGYLFDYEDVVEIYGSKAAVKSYSSTANGSRRIAQTNSTKKDVGNNTLAFKYYSMAADSGLFPAQFNVALAYLKGVGVTQNYSEAFRYMQMCAAQDSECQMLLGYFYEKGFGISVNLTNAAVQYSLAAKSGDPNAQCFLGRLYYRGEGVDKNTTLGLELLESAVTNGYRMCQQDVLLAYLELAAGASNSSERFHYLKQIVGLDDDDQAREDSFAGWYALGCLLVLCLAWGVRSLPLNHIRLTTARLLHKVVKIFCQSRPEARDRILYVYDEQVIVPDPIYGVPLVAIAEADAVAATAVIPSEDVELVSVHSPSGTSDSHTDNDENAPLIDDRTSLQRVDFGPGSTLVRINQSSSQSTRSDL